jgi:hypothetical protein
LPKLRFWRNTEVAQLKPGRQRVLGYGILGHEWNEDLDNGFRPAGLIRMSTTTVNNVPYIQDYGTVYAAGTATHHLTLFRAPSGALVFSAGTVQWAWGLDPNHDTETGIPPERANSTDIRVGVDLKGAVRAIQQATLNLLADMGAQPTTMQPGLVKTTASSDRTSPISRVDPGGARALGSGLLEIRVRHPTRGGVVGGVEVSTDGGATWHPAQGTTRWTLPLEVRIRARSLRSAAARWTIVATSKRANRFAIDTEMTEDTEERHRELGRVRCDETAASLCRLLCGSLCSLLRVPLCTSSVSLCSLCVLTATGTPGPTTSPPTNCAGTTRRAADTSPARQSPSQTKRSRRRRRS